MNKKNQNTILWIIGIVVLLIVVTKLPLPGFPFAIITKTTCVDNTISYYDFEVGYDNLISGKLGNAIEFNESNTIDLPISSEDFVVMWVKNYSLGDTDYYFIANLNGTNYVNGILDNTKQIIPLGPDFGLGFNGSIDEIGTFSSLSVEKMMEIYNNNTGRLICYTTTYEENVSCKDYATEQVIDSGTGCLNYSGDYFPTCEYELETTSSFYVLGSVCEKRFYCEDILSSDFSSLILCQDSLIVEEPSGDTIAAPSITPPVEEKFIDKLKKDVFKIGGFGVKLIYLIIALMVVVALIYFMKDGKK